MFKPWRPAHSCKRQTSAVHAILLNAERWLPAMRAAVFHVRYAARRRRRRR